MENDKKVVFLNTSNIYGGVEKNFIVRAKALQELGFPVYVVTGSTVIQARVIDAGVQNVYYIRCTNDYDLIFLLRFLHFLLKIKPSVIFLNTKRDFWRGGIPAKLANVKKIIGYWGSDYAVGNNVKINFIFKSVLDIVIVNSLELKEKLLARGFKIKSHQINVIYNGIESVNLNNVQKLNIRTRYNIPSNAIIMGSAGRLVSAKNFHTGLMIMKALTNCDFIFYVLAGDGPHKKHLQSIAAEYGVLGRFIMLGDIHNLSHTTFFNEIDFFAFFSSHEGLPNVLVEALYYNKPVISTNASGVSEVLDNGKYGRILPDDFSAMVITFNDFILNEIKVSKESKQYVLNKFSRVAMIDETCKVFYEH